MEVKILKAGYCHHCEKMVFAGGAWKKRRFYARVGYVVHPTMGNILIDTGYSPWFISCTNKFPEILYRWLIPVTVTPEDTVAQQLAHLSVEGHINHINHIILTHFHGDHIGGLRDFSQAKIHCTSKAYLGVAKLKGLRAVANGFLADLCPSDMKERLFYVNESHHIKLPYAEFPEGLDWSGDGKIVIVDLPGHAPGHCGVLLNKDVVDRESGNVKSEKGPVFFVGDASWDSVKNGHTAKLQFLSQLFIHERRSYFETLEKLKSLSSSHPEIEIVASHQLEDF